MTKLGYWWRAGLMAFAVLSMSLAVVGFVFTQFDDQYATDVGIGRLSVGVLAGVYAALVYSPVSVVASVFLSGLSALQVDRVVNGRTMASAVRAAAIAVLGTQAAMLVALVWIADANIGWAIAFALVSGVPLALAASPLLAIRSDSEAQRAKDGRQQTST